MNNFEELKQQHFLKDKKGNIVIWQWPNIPLYGWIVFKILSLVLPSGHLKHGSDLLSMAFLFTWAFLELTAGDNYLRRILGALVLLSIIISFFK